MAQSDMESDMGHTLYRCKEWSDMGGVIWDTRFIAVTIRSEASSLVI